MAKQYIQKWLIDLLADGPYRDEREVKAEQRTIRENAKAEVDRIWESEAKKLAPPAPVAPLPPPDWGTSEPPSVETPDSAPRGKPPIVETDPGIGAVSRLAEPLPAPQAPDYWSGVDGRPLGQIETIA